MIPVIYNDQLKADYQHLWDTCIVTHNAIALADNLVRRINQNQSRYQIIAAAIGCPWFFIGLVHHMECGLSFDKHLHNGDPLKAKTVHIPRNRPAGTPPWTWETSALDALKLTHIDLWHDWSIPGILYKLEGYNGYGYRQYHPEVKTPYLWSMTNQYVKGKYVSDGKYDRNAVSAQLGIAAILKRGVALGVFAFK